MGIKLYLDSLFITAYGKTLLVLFWGVKKSATNGDTADNVPHGNNHVVNGRDSGDHP